MTRTFCGVNVQSVENGQVAEKKHRVKNEREGDAGEGVRLTLLWQLTSSACAAFAKLTLVSSEWQLSMLEVKVRGELKTTILWQCHNTILHPVLGQWREERASDKLWTQTSPPFWPSAVRWTSVMPELPGQGTLFVTEGKKMAVTVYLSRGDVFSPSYLFWVKRHAQLGSGSSMTGVWILLRMLEC